MKSNYQKNSQGILARPNRPLIVASGQTQAQIQICLRLRATW